MWSLYGRGQALEALGRVEEAIGVFDGPVRIKIEHQPMRLLPRHAHPDPDLLGAETNSLRADKDIPSGRTEPPDEEALGRHGPLGALGLA